MRGEDEEKRRRPDERAEEEEVERKKAAVLLVWTGARGECSRLPHTQSLPRSDRETRLIGHDSSPCAKPRPLCESQRLDAFWPPFTPCVDGLVLVLGRGTRSIPVSRPLPKYSGRWIHVAEDG